MENEIRVETKINAPVEKVWKILTDFDRYADWNPLIPRISASLITGSPVSFTLVAHGLELPVFGAEMVNVEPNKDFRWAGPSIEILQSVARLEHYFSLEKTDETSCRFIHGEFATGLLGGPVFQLLKTAESGYYELNDALKRRAEA